MRQVLIIINEGVKKCYLKNNKNPYLTVLLIAIMYNRTKFR